jgi:DUF917 family protein
MDAIRECGAVSLLRADEVPDDAFLMPMMGAPTVPAERAINGSEYAGLHRMIETTYAGEVFAAMPMEAAGGPGMLLRKI